MPTKTLIEKAQESTFIKTSDGQMLRIESTELEDGRVCCTDEDTHENFEFDEEGLEGCTFYRLQEF